MENFDQLDQLLKYALSSTVEPSEDLNQKIITKLKEREDNIMKPVKRRVSVAVIAAALTLTISITAFAAWHFLNPGQVAEHLENQTLTQAFESKDAIEINESVTSGGYNFTLHGIVSGKGISDFKHSAEDINPDRTYAVVSIARQDGSKMPDTQDEDYGQVPFFISPLVKGQKPWMVNIATMNGAYSEFVIDGVNYRLIECDGIEIFADRGLYLCISTSPFYDIDAFSYNEETGEITPNPDYSGANALFNLPLDTKKADHEKAEKYLKELWNEPDTDPTGEIDIDWDKEFESGVVIPESIKKVTFDKNGLACYEYDGWKVNILIDDLFEEGEVGIYKTINISEGENGKEAMQFSKDQDGVITGRIIKLD